MGLVKVEVYLTRQQVKMLNELVDLGLYADMSEAVREAIRHYFAEKYRILQSVKVVKESINVLKQVQRYFKNLERRNRNEEDYDSLERYR